MAFLTGLIGFVVVGCVCVCVCVCTNASLSASGYFTDIKYVQMLAFLQVVILMI